MKRRNAEFGKLRRPMKRNKIAEGMYGRYSSYYPSSSCISGSSIDTHIIDISCVCVFFAILFVVVLFMYMCARESAIWMLCECMRVCVCMNRLLKAIIYTVRNVISANVCVNVQKYWIYMCALYVRG